MHTVFIIPYRDRPEQKQYFEKYFKEHIASRINETDTYEYFFSHQMDQRPFNRGAMKNIGFLIVRNKYPDTWKDITYVFHDIDCYPIIPSTLPYKTVHGKVAHYYGIQNTLGGIVVIKGSDFMKTAGYPNFWGWGYEDNLLYDRCLSSKLIVDRSIFYDMNDGVNMIRLDKTDNIKYVSPADITAVKTHNADSVNHIRMIDYIIVGHMLNVSSFIVPHLPGYFFKYNLLDGEKSPDKYMHQRGINNCRRSWKLF